MPVELEDQRVACLVGAGLGDLDHRTGTDAGIEHLGHPGAIGHELPEGLDIGAEIGHRACTVALDTDAVIAAELARGQRQDNRHVAAEPRPEDEAFRHQIGIW